MMELRFTLISDGSSDKALLPILHWLLSQYYPDTPINGEWADLTGLSTPPNKLTEKILISCRLYPCDLLFIHRDAENKSLDIRREEIAEAVTNAQAEAVTNAQDRLHESNEASLLPNHICVIPVRMTETWLLFDDLAIRKAASNPNGRVPLSLPSFQKLEHLPDPKKELYDLLRKASELRGRRLKKFKPREGVHRLAECIDDYSRLRNLPAFQALENEIRKLVS